MEFSDDQYCFVCGKNNPDGLQITFDHQADGITKAYFTPQKKFQGYKDVLHGGLISTLLDEVMVASGFPRDLKTVTAELTVRFIKPAVIGEELIFTGEITSQKGRICIGKAKAETRDGKLIAEAEGKLVKIK